jgi:hypothetical protein
VKTIIAILALASPVATAAVAKTENYATHAVAIYTIQTHEGIMYPNPDRDFSIENLRSHAN